MDDALVKMISQLKVEYEQPLMAMERLRVKANELDASIRNLHLTAAQLNRTFGLTTVGNIQHTVQQTGVLYDQYGRVLLDVSVRSEEVAKQTRTATEAIKDQIKPTKDLTEAYSVLGSQWERRVSWFIAGAGFYGGIRAMRAMLETIKQIESDMVAIARVSTDVTFRIDYMRNELIKLGKDFGHAWEQVADIAIRWAQAGYNMADTLQMTRNSLLALNVAEMDARMASEGLIAIMAQWGLQASDIELVIDKLNITSDRYAVTTGDLVDALVRASGTARAVNMTFDDTVGIITAMRVATGRAGREVGNAVSTILSYITRQTTLNKLMEAGIDVFADAARTKLRPAIDILRDFALKWSDNAEAVPEQLMQIAEEAGLLTEEMAELVDMQAEWNDLQKIDLETSAAGVRRRNFLIALLRNFAMVTDVVTNMQDAQGYSMIQNIMTMETLEKRTEALKMAFQELAVAIGEAGLSGGLKTLVDLLRQAVEWFSHLPQGVQSFTVSLAALTLALTVFTSIVKMAGIDVAALGTALVNAKKIMLAAITTTHGLSGAVAALGGVLKSLAGIILAPKLLLAGLAAAFFASYVSVKRANEEFERQLKLASLMSAEYDRLDRQLELSIQGSTIHNATLEAKKKLTDEIVKVFPELIQGYDRENNMIKVNTDALREMANQYDQLNKARNDSVSEAEKQLKIAEENVAAIESEKAKLEDDIRRITDMANKRALLAKAIANETTDLEQLERYKKDEAEARRIITKLIDDEAAQRIEAAGWSMEAIDAEVAKIKEKVENLRTAKREAIKAQIDETKELITQTQNRIEAMLRETEVIKTRNAALKRSLEPGLEYGFGRTVQQYINAYTKQVKENVRAITEDEARVDELVAKLKELEGQLDETVPTVSSSTYGAGDSVKKLTEIVREYIDAVMRASEVQELLNNETQRIIDLAKTRIEFLKRDTASHSEWMNGLKEEASLLPLLRQQQENINKQANLLRTAKEALIRKQNTLNISTEEGFEAYKLLESQIDSISDSINKLSIEWYSLQQQQEIGISNLERIRSVRQDNISMMQTAIDYYTREAASIEDLTKAESIRIVLLGQMQELEQQYINQIAEQERRIASATELLNQGQITQEQWNKVVADATSEINSLTSGLYKNKTAMEEMQSATIESTKTFNSMIKDIDYYSRLGVFTVDQLIKYTRMAFDKIRGSMTLEQERDEIIRLASLYKEQFGIIQRIAEEAYRARLEALQKSVDEEIAFYQQQLDALDEEEKLEDREELRRQHEQKMADLLEQRRYHELRTGIEHERAIVDIDRQIAEEQRSWDLKQSEWARQDKRDDLNKQIEDIRKSAEEQRAEWEKAYQRMEADFDDHIVAMLALSSAHDPDFFEDAKRKAQMWIEGFKSGLPEDLIGNYLSGIATVPSFPSRTTGGTGGTEESRETETPQKRIIDIYDFDLVNGRAYMPARKLAEALDEYISWNDRTGKVAIGGYEFSPFVGEQKYANALAGGTAWLSVRDVGTKLGYSVEYLGNMIRLMKNAHTGAKVITPGIANLQPGELIFPRNLSLQLERLISLLSATPISHPLGEKGVVFNAPLNYVDKQIISDDVDAEIISRELVRQINLKW